VAGAPHCCLPAAAILCMHGAQCWWLHFVMWTRRGRPYLMLGAAGPVAWLTSLAWGEWGAAHSLAGMQNDWNSTAGQHVNGCLRLGCELEIGRSRVNQLTGVLLSQESCWHIKLRATACLSDMVQPREA
jgi:hypothetical protein